MDWPLPSTGSNLASAIGLGDFLRDHVRHYADITAPLIALKNQKQIVWTDTTRRHWSLFKRALANAPLLKFPNFTLRFAVAVDASQTGIGGVLYQPDDADNTMTPDNIVAICSKKLNGTQRNYPVYKKELWGLIYSLRKFHGFIWGRRDVTVLTDHKPLIHILKQRVLSVALQQWLDVLLDYDLTIHYRPGILNIIPDALSRMYEATYCDDSITWGTISNIKLLEKFISSDPSHTASGVLPSSDTLCIQSLEEIKPLSAVKKRHRALSPEIPSKFRSVGKDKIKVTHVNPIPSQLTEEVDVDDLCEFDECMHSTHPLYAASEEGTARIARLALAEYATVERFNFEYLIESYSHEVDDMNVELPTINTLTTEQKLLVAQEKRGKVLPSATKQEALLVRAHAAGHFGERAMYTHIDREGFWWPQMRQDIATVIDGCLDCQRHSITVRGFHPARSIHALQPGDHYQIDLAALPKSMYGEIFCLVLVDVCSGFIILRPLKDKAADTIARTLWDIFCTIGLPKVLQSDNGTEFCNQTLRAVQKLIGVPHRFISEYNPRADGKVERVVGTVKNTLYKLLKGASVFWPHHLPFVQLAYNDKIQSLTGSTAFSMMFNRSANLPVDYTLDVNTNEAFDAAKWEAHQSKVLSLIFPAIAKRVDKHQAEYRARLDKIRRSVFAEGLKPGTTVWIKDPKYLLSPNTRPSGQQTHIGPYTVNRQNKYGAYILNDGTGQQLNRTVPLDQMLVRMPARKRASNGAPLTPASNGDEKEILKIHEFRVSEDTGSLSYLVQWKNHTLAQATWVCEDDFVDTDVIDKFYREQSMQSIGKRLNQQRLRALNSVVLRISCDRPACGQHR